tara:strand:+ start:217 stop:1218 length:1002 start_codon:yes stop_codon:yes gene_type:complete
MNNNKIDIVYTWVNGNDPNWLNKKESFINQNPNILENKRVNSKERFFNNDELKFSLRSVQKYAKWINNIYIITDNQKPEWLNLAHPKIKLIDHREIFDEEYLPCFNSSAIETSLHKIKELSNYFLFFNDDLFLGRETSMGDFFKDNSPKLFSGKENISIQDLHKKERKNEFQYAIHNARLAIYRKYNFFCGFNLRHGIKVLDKNSLSELEIIFSNEFKATRFNRFRNSSDIHVMSLYAYYLVAQGLNQKHYLKVLRRDLFRYKINYLRKDRDHMFVPLSTLSIKKINSKFSAIKKYTPLMFCINDGPNVSDSKRDIVKIFLKEFYPNKSAFEK